MTPRSDCRAQGHHVQCRNKGLPTCRILFSGGYLLSPGPDDTEVNAVDPTDVRSRECETPAERRSRVDYDHRSGNSELWFDSEFWLAQHKQRDNNQGFTDCHQAVKKGRSAGIGTPTDPTAAKPGPSPDRTWV